MGRLDPTDTAPTEPPWPWDDHTFREQLRQQVLVARTKARAARAARSSRVSEHEAHAAAAADGVDLTPPLSARALAWAASNCPAVLARNTDWIEESLRAQNASRAAATAAEAPGRGPGAHGAEATPVDGCTAGARGPATTKRGAVVGPACTNQRSLKPNSDSGVGHCED